MAFRLGPFPAVPSIPLVSPRRGDGGSLPDATWPALLLPAGGPCGLCLGLPLWRNCPLRGPPLLRQRSWACTPLAWGEEAPPRAGGVPQEVRPPTFLHHPRRIPQGRAPSACAGSPLPCGRRGWPLSTALRGRDQDRRPGRVDVRNPPARGPGGAAGRGNGKGGLFGVHSAPAVALRCSRGDGGAGAHPFASRDRPAPPCYPLAVPAAGLPAPLLRLVRGGLSISEGPDQRGKPRERKSRWCRAGESNPQGLGAQRILSPPRLPVSPARHCEGA